MLLHGCVLLLPEKQLAPVRPSQTRIANAMPLVPGDEADVPPPMLTGIYTPRVSCVSFLRSSSGIFTFCRPIHEENWSTQPVADMLDKRGANAGFACDGRAPAHGRRSRRR